VLAQAPRDGVGLFIVAAVLPHRFTAATRALSLHLRMVGVYSDCEKEAFSNS